VAGRPERSLGFIEELECILSLPALKRKPTLVDLCHCYELWRFGSLSGSARRCDVKVRVFIVASLPMSTALPEVCQED
jgi:hypothetical protein